MVKKRMAMRMVTIFVALIVCGMFFPGSVRGAISDSVSIDTGYKDEEGNIVVEFKELQLNEASLVPVKLTNKSDKSLTLRLLLQSDFNCKFQLDSWLVTLGPNESVTESLTVNFTYEPSNYGQCGAKLPIINHVTDEILGTILLIGVLEEPGEEPKDIVIGGFNTGVLDREDEDGELISDMIRECKETATNIGSAQRCISRLTKHLMWHDKLSREERQALMNTAWRSAMSEVMQKMKAAKSSGKRDRRCSRFWWRNFHHHWRH